MHTSAYNNCKKFKEKYLRPCTVLDVGSLDVNGCLKPIFEGYEYTGLDLSEGKNVDVVLKDRYKFPFTNGAFSTVVSSSTFEHDESFWITFNEMERVLENGGYMYINTPNRGNYHGYPGDCWRFMKDAYRALERWNGKVELIEQYIDGSESWQDNVGIFKK